ncbi:hypothetical protein [Desulfotalea psychrophila]|uniref:Lipoprotein n=1 Tax=Desulfotalea psychrophila (strain LSv54 / DSM 12343) TaxID=177439 RepID=Q6AQL8_DESPS|nr:hypothetical protein [Desulfotalea psychrophila]CAG35355.1 unknown protein [Desulfotalea psychrophila LSv54]
MKGSYGINFFCLLLLLSLLQACGGREYSYQDTNNKPDTPGLITGEAGQYHILRAKEVGNALAKKGVAEESVVKE